MSFRALETAYRGLISQQRAVDTSNHNVANANTPGFSRQRVLFTPTAPYTVPAFNRSALAGQVGTGATVAAITRVREYVFDFQLRVQSEALGDASTRVTTYTQLEGIFNEPGENGLGALLDRFWRTWQAVTNQPEDLAARASLVQESTTLAANLNRIRQQLGQLREDLIQKLTLQTGEVNSIAERVAALNAQITAAIATGQNPNDLVDQRDLLLDQLAQFTGVTARTLPNGAVNLYLGGYPLVDQDQSFALKVVISGGTASIAWQASGSAAAIQRGSLTALLDLHNTVVPGLLAQVESIRDALANKVNALHQTGYGLTDTLPPPPGRDFFEILPSGDLRVNPALVSDPALIAASSAPGAPGNNDVARQIADLRYALVMNSNTATVNDFYNALIAKLGGDSRQAQVAKENQETLVQAIDRQRQEISAVSIDEEMANLVKFQHAYQAAARAITAVDEMLDRIINGMGIVGR